MTPTNLTSLANLSVAPCAMCPKAAEFWCVDAGGQTWWLCGDCALANVDVAGTA